MEYALLTEKLTRIFREPKKDITITALDEVSLQVRRGELFGLLGPNGAGKTTLIKILSTLLLPSSGKAYVAGHDVEGDPLPIRKIINLIAGGEYSGYGILSVRENLWMFSQFYNVERKTAEKRIDELIDIVELREKASTRVHKLSTGMRQKLNFARGFVNDPQIIFLDEPTLGLDVATSKKLRTYIKSWLSEKKERTVLLTTHYMAEADELCDRVAIINGGKIVACDSPGSLKKLVAQQSSFHITVRNGRGDFHDLGSLPHVKALTVSDGPDGSTRDLHFILENDLPLEVIFQKLTEQDAKVVSVKRSDTTLEDVFLSLCGRSLE
ncbi:MAG: ABC transporter ATP-binding protein [Candidatus Eremiobacteraeota bacterium]|nr:ABC transporter ATP-binding protein [Candidatus Eremiobacteraeota bacterium]